MPTAHKSGTFIVEPALIAPVPGAWEAGSGFRKLERSTAPERFAFDMKSLTSKDS